MGYSDWSDVAYRRVTTARAGAVEKEIFRDSRNIDPLMDPRRIQAREARDSEHHPRSVPIIVAFDVTASMGHIPTRFATELLGRLMRMLVENGWVEDPQILFAAIGDAVSDRAPLQVGQFESGLEMDMWLTRLWIEGQGGDVPESYTLAHWFAAHHTATDAWEKRGEKGWLFTIGDACNKPLRPSHVQRVFGYRPDAPVDDASVIAAADERYHLCHFLVSQPGAVVAGELRHWRERLGERVHHLPEVDRICDVMGVKIGRQQGRLTAPDATQILVERGLTAKQAAEIAR
ncbi:MAG: hypothetical protein ACI8RZ_004494 [Myxococcota bacterium]|jgi:hypothetical protein